LFTRSVAARPRCSIEASYRLKVSAIGCFLVAGADVDQPRAIQAPGVNDDVARAILTRIEKLVALIVNAIETMDLMDGIDTQGQLEKLRSFTG
jgi:hypothetical protein